MRRTGQGSRRPQPVKAVSFSHRFQLTQEILLLVPVCCVLRSKTLNLLIRGSGRDGYSTDGSFGRVNGRLVSVEAPAQTIRLPKGAID
jgi:hypothetical protein